MTKFTLSIELDNALQIEILATLAEIVANEGRIIVDGEPIQFFLQDIIHALRNKENYFITGKLIDDRWIGAAGDFEEIARLIRDKSKIK